MPRPRRDDSEEAFGRYWHEDIERRVGRIEHALIAVGVLSVMIVLYFILQASGLPKP